MKLERTKFMHVIDEIHEIQANYTKTSSCLYFQNKASEQQTCMFSTTAVYRWEDWQYHPGESQLSQHQLLDWHEHGFYSNWAM